MPEFATSDFGGYLLHERIGAGGMAEIFLATAQGIEGFEKRLVIKRILPTLSDDDQFVRMFIEEAKLCVALRHPNIVQVYDLGVIESQYYIAMEYVDGRDLLKTLAACGKKKIGFPTDIALYIVMEVLKGLDYAHKVKRSDGEPLGIIHRDVSPSNVLLSFEGEVKIGDFGIAKASTREKTATGILKGKFGYMAPEQVTGAQIDSRADIFAMGIVLYELLTGHRLFAGKNDLAVLERVRDALIEPHPRFYRADLDPELETIVMRALSRERGDRFQSATELHDAISEYVFKNRAQVTAASLGRFMQGLFLADADELARRERIHLPAPKAFPAAGRVKAAMPQPPSFGPESTREDRNGNGSTEEDIDLEGDFEEQTPLLELTPDMKKRRRHSSVSGQAFISTSDDWEPDPNESLELPMDSTKNSRANGEGKKKKKKGGAVPGLESADAVDVGSGNILDTRPASLSGWIDGNGAREEIEAMRQAQAENEPTDFNLDKKKKKKKKGSDNGRSETRSGRRLADPLRSDPKIERSISALTDPLPAQAQQIEDVSTDFSPHEIVERSQSTSEDKDGIETQRFDSGVSSAVRDNLDKKHPRLGFPAEEDSDFGTVEVPDSDMPTAEVDEADLESLDDEDDTTGESSRLAGGLPQVPPASSSEILVAAVPGEELDAFEEETAGSDRNASPVRRPATGPTEDTEERGPQVDRRLNALPTPRAESVPSRRRPIAGRRERPVLLPADDDPNGLRPSRRAALSARTLPRRRFTTRASLSVVNPSSVSGKPSIEAKGIPERTAKSPAAPIKEPLPDRRDSSGVTAALSEAREVDDAIAEIRATSTGAAEVGGLAGAMGSDAELPIFDPDEPTADGSEVSQGAGISQGVMRRQSRRRMMTRNVVLFEDSDAAKNAGQREFPDEASVPLITSAGKLDDEGASELFGVLSKLDESRESFGPDEEVSIETDARPYEALSESLGRVEALTIPTSEHETPDSMEETNRGEESAEISVTHLGRLTSGGSLPETTRKGGPPMPPELDTEASFASDEETTTTSQDAPPPPSKSQGASAVPKVVSPGPSSGIAIDFSVLASGAGTGEGHSESMNTAPSHSDALAMPQLRQESGFGDNEEPTEQATEESVSQALARNLLQPTNEERPSLTPDGRLLSESFELSYEEREEIVGKPKKRPPTPPPAPKPAAKAPAKAAPSKAVAQKAPAKASPSKAVAHPEPPSTPPPVRPVTYVPDEPPSEPQFARPPVAQKPPTKGGGGDNGLRAVVERNRPVKEKRPNKGNAPGRAAATGPPPATGTPGLVFPVNSASPSLGPAVDPRRAAPSFGEGGAVVRVDAPRRQVSLRTWTMYVVVLVAVTLAVAAAWVSFQSPRPQTPIQPMNQLQQQTEKRAPAPAPAERPAITAPAEKTTPPPGAAAPLDKAATERAAAEKIAQEKANKTALAEKVRAEQEAKDKAAAEKAAAAKAASDKANAGEKAAAAAERAKNDRARAERVRNEKAAVAKKAAEKKKAAAEKAKAPKPAPADNQAYLSINCSDPATIRVGGDKFTEQTNFKQAFRPGPYQLTIIRPGKTPFRGTVNLVAGQTAKSPCGE